MKYSEKKAEFKWILIGLIIAQYRMESNRVCRSSLEKEMEVSPGSQVELKSAMSHEKEQSSQQST